MGLPLDPTSAEIAPGFSRRPTFQMSSMVLIWVKATPSLFLQQNIQRINPVSTVAAIKYEANASVHRIWVTLTLVWYKLRNGKILHADPYRACVTLGLGLMSSGSSLGRKCTFGSGTTQVLIPYRHLSCSCCSCWSDLLQKAQGSVVSSPIGMKFGKIVPRVNTHRQSDFGYDVILSRWPSWRRFEKRTRSLPRVTSLARNMRYSTSSTVYSYLFENAIQALQYTAASKIYKSYNMGRAVLDGGAVDKTRGRGCGT